MSDIPPIFISAKKAAEMLAITPWSIYKLCDEGQLVSQYHGKRRLIRLSSVQEYADNLPMTQETA